MKNLNEILSESIFDDDLTTNNQDTLVKTWADAFFKDWVSSEKSGVDHIDEASKTIFLKTTGWDAYVVAKDQPFTGFIDEYKIVNCKNKEITTIYFAGDIRSINNIPKSVNGILFYSDFNTTIRDNVCEEINKQFKTIKTLEFLNISQSKWNGLDLTKLTSAVGLLHIGGSSEDAEIKFNVNQKVGTLQFGYDSIFHNGGKTSKVVNLPIVKTLSFKSGDFESIRSMIEGLENKGNSNFKSMNISCRDLNAQEKEALKKLLQGEETDFAGYGKILKKIESINSIVNDNDGSKDRFGESLEPGDVVLVADTTNPKWPSFLDIYKGCSSNGRIRTESRMQLPPRNVIKINNPKILDLLK